MLQTVLEYGPVVLALLGGLTAVAVALAGLAAAIAPLTKTDADDKLAAALGKVVAVLRFLQDKAALLGLAKVAVPKATPSPLNGAGPRLVDHRTKP